MYRQNPPRVPITPNGWCQPRYNPVAPEFASLPGHYTDEPTAELVAAIAFFGFLHRWNDILATDLEGVPLRFAQAHLAEQGWEPGRHAG